MEQQFRKLAGTPGSDGLNSCPTVLDIVGTDKVFVQGEKPDEETLRALNIPPGEDGVIVPKELYLRGAKQLSEELDDPS